MRKTIPTLGIFAALTAAYHFLSLRVTLDEGNLLLTISSFLFAIFTGFFMSRQGERYSAIREAIAEFDGNMTALYRDFGHLSKELQARAADIIRRHYATILEKRAWDWHFVNKSDTITSLHAVLDDAGVHDAPEVQEQAIEGVRGALDQLQIVRKSMIGLHVERIPAFQWTLIVILAAVLLASISGVPSTLLGSILKGAFGTSVVLVIMLLRDFDGLRFFEGAIGTSSAQDILGILEGKK
ncbi:MAG TPA: hypothetical protein VJ694_01460 [Patescibacteria group bacterium]|nr:hypothetical protein [Patescibacteria group bacterium]